MIAAVVIWTGIFRGRRSSKGGEPIALRGKAWLKVSSSPTISVSTTRQGQNGLGLEAQRKAVTDFLDGGNWQLVAEAVEIESGKRSDRPKLQEALRLAAFMERPSLSPSWTVLPGMSPSSRT